MRSAILCATLVAATVARRIAFDSVIKRARTSTHLIGAQLMDQILKVPLFTRLVAGACAPCRDRYKLP